MGIRKKFSVAEQELLRANPYTEKVTEHQISFTLAFKEAFWRLSVEGCTGNMALRKLGYDPELLGFERVHNITKRIRRAGKSPEGIQPAPKSRMRISREQFGAAELEKMSRRESERRMQQEIVYLQQQMAFLKNLCGSRKARIRIPAAWKRETETQINRKTRHTQPLKLNMACFFVDQSRLTDAHFVLFG